MSLRKRSGSRIREEPESGSRWSVDGAVGGAYFSYWISQVKPAVTVLPCNGLSKAVVPRETNVHVTR
jgi:hypothetical protein